MGKPYTTQLASMMCQECGCEEWLLFLEVEGDKTYLNYTCANDKCREASCIKQGGERGTIIIWGRIDVTGQGFEACPNFSTLKEGPLLN